MLFFFFRIFLWLLIIINASDIQSSVIKAKCADNTERYKCYIDSPLVLSVGDSLQFDGIVDRQNEIREFNITYDANIPLIPRGIFETFLNLEDLRMSTSLKDIFHNDFEYAHSLYNLSLSDNKIEKIRNSVFSSAKNLNELHLDGNEILILEDYAFNGLDKLYYLTLNKNRIITLKALTFHGAPHLTDLRLENNEIETIEDGAFELPNLLYLYLGYNQLKQLPDNIFTNTHLLGLDLRSNPLTHLGDAVYNLTRIATLVLTNTQVDDIDLRRFADMKSLNELILDKHLDGGRYNGSDLQTYRKMLHDNNNNRV